MKVQWFQSNYLSTLNNKVSLTINELDLDSPEGSICGSGILVRLSLPVQVQFRRNVPNISDLDFTRFTDFTLLLNPILCVHNIV